MRRGSLLQVGLDIGRTWLDAASDGPVSALPRRVANETAGIEQVVAALVAAAPTLVVLEATGTDHRPVLTALLAAGIPTALVNPAQVAAFRQARLGREKSDRPDARLLARVAAVQGDELRRATASDPVQARLRDLVADRDGHVAERTRLKNRLHANGVDGDDWGRTRLVADLAETEARVAEVEREIARLLDTVPEAQVLQKMKGGGPRVAAAVLAYVPTAIGGDAKAAAADAGVHPRREQSGQRDRGRLSNQGHAGLRRYLYRAASVAVQDDPDLAAFRDRLRGRGKSPQRAQCAVMHKRLRRMMGTLRAFWLHQSPVSLTPSA